MGSAVAGRRYTIVGQGFEHLLRTRAYRRHRQEGRRVRERLRVTQHCANLGVPADDPDAKIADVARGAFGAQLCVHVIRITNVGRLEWVE